MSSCEPDSHELGRFTSWTRFLVQFHVPWTDLSRLSDHHLSSLILNALPVKSSPHIYCSERACKSHYNPHYTSIKNNYALSRSLLFGNTEVSLFSWNTHIVVFRVLIIQRLRCCHGISHSSTCLKEGFPWLRVIACNVSWLSGRSSSILTLWGGLSVFKISNK